MSTLSEPILLYDLPCKGQCVCWSGNPWKTRMLLNYKGLSYKTEWVEYPHLKPALEKYLAPNETGFAYTSPAVRLPPSEYVMDSKKIAIRIEELYPTPSVRLDAPILIRVEDAVSNIFATLTPAILLLVPELLNPVSAEYFYSTREKELGSGSLEDQLRNSDQAYTNVAKWLKDVVTLLAEDCTGPYFLGQEASYADFVFAGFLIFSDRLGILEKVLGQVDDTSRKQIAQFYEACAPWRTRDDL